MTTLILDCSYLCRRAQHTTGQFSYEGESTGVCFGFLRELLLLQDRFATDDVIFAFDSPTSKRRRVCESYKAHRDNHKCHWDTVRWRDENDFHKQVQKLRESVLPKLGYRNILWQDGYEADDLIASVCLDCSGQFIIVSSDQDLFQLFRGTDVRMWLPQQKKLLDLFWFTREYRITPSDWIKVKCIAGCRTDGIRGVDGVGEKTAIRYLLGRLPHTHKAYQNIQRSQEIIEGNRVLVELPFSGASVPAIQQNKCSSDKWDKVLAEMGMETLRQEVPGFHRRKVMK